MKKKYIVTLTEEERQMLQEMLSRGKAPARKLTHARILLKADAAVGGPGWNDEAIAETLEVGRATVERGTQGVRGRRSGSGTRASQTSPPVSANA
jgi:hypothetical protein